MHTMEHYSVLKRKEILSHDTTWMSLEDIMLHKINQSWASLVAQWLRIHLPMQGTWVRSLAREDPPCLGETKPMCHNY